MKKLLAISGVILLLVLLSGAGCSTGAVGRIVFLGHIEGQSGNYIYSMNPDGSELVMLTRWSPHLMPYHNIWSADGSTLACLDYNEDTQESWLCVVDGDGQNRRKLLEVTDLKMDSMALSPDGKTVVLSLDSTRVSRIETPRGGTVHIEITKDQDLDLFTVDVKTGELKRLTDTPDIMEKWPSYSPDGKEIGFVGRIDTEEIRNVPRDVFVMDADGGNRRHLAHHTEGMFVLSELRWSPDGSKIAYTFYTMSINDYQHYTDIFVIDVKEGGYSNVTDSPYITDDAPSWSPDSRKIAFYSGNMTEGSRAWVMDVDGNNKTELYYTGGPPSWTPDGKGPIFTNRLNVYKVMVIDADGENLRTLARSDSTRISIPTWLSR